MNNGATVHHRIGYSFTITMRTCVPLKHVPVTCDCVGVTRHILPDPRSYSILCAVSAMVDPFATAVFDMNDGAVVAVDTVYRAMDAPVVRSAPANADESIVAAVPQASSSTMAPKKKDKKTYSPRPPSQLSPRPEHDDPTQNIVCTIFVDPPEAGKQASGAVKRKLGTRVPVTIWPQYTLSGLADVVFVVVSPTEWWMNAILHAVRPRSSPQTARNMRASLADLTRLWIRSGLTSLKREADEDAESGDDNAAQNKKTWERSFSGVKLKNMSLLDVNIDGAAVTVLNYGKLFVLKLNDAGIRFLQWNVVNACRNLRGDAEEDASSSSQRAQFAFDNETPNIPDKIRWDCDKNAWKVTYQNAKGKVTSYADMDNVTLVVPDCGTEAEHVAKKLDSYWRAIRTWNALDVTKRDRIDLLATPSTTSQPATLQAKWTDDSASLVL